AARGRAVAAEGRHPQWLEERNEGGAARREGVSEVAARAGEGGVMAGDRQPRHVMIAADVEVAGLRGVAASADGAREDVELRRADGDMREFEPPFGVDDAGEPRADEGAEDDLAADGVVLGDYVGEVDAEF